MLISEPVWCMGPWKGFSWVSWLAKHRAQISKLPFNLFDEYFQIITKVIIYNCVSARLPKVQNFSAQVAGKLNENKNPVSETSSLYVQFIINVAKVKSNNFLVWNQRVFFYNFEWSTWVNYVSSDKMVISTDIWCNRPGFVPGLWLNRIRESIFGVLSKFTFSCMMILIVEKLVSFVHNLIFVPSQKVSTPT